MSKISSYKECPAFLPQRWTNSWSEENESALRNVINTQALESFNHAVNLYTFPANTKTIGAFGMPTLFLGYLSRHKDYGMLQHFNKIHRNIKVIEREEENIHTTKEKVQENLVDKFLDLLNLQKKEMPKKQMDLVMGVIDEISENCKKINAEIFIKYSVENEFLFVKESKKGVHYVFVGEEENDLSYGFVGKKKGVSNHIVSDFNKIGIKEIVRCFFNE